MIDDSRQPTAPIPVQPSPSAPSAGAASPTGPSTSGPTRPASSAAPRPESRSERDDRLMHHGRKRRAQRQEMRKRRQTALAIAGAVVLAAVAIGFGVFLWQTADANAPTRVTGEGAEKGKIGLLGRALASTSDKSVADIARSGIKPEPDALPTFASYRGLKLHIPVPPKKLTEIGFHQAARDYALHIHTGLKVYSTEKLRKTRTTGAHPVHGKGDDAKLGGYYVKMWRNRPGAPDSAIDIGANPGTPVYAPVTGTVVKVRHYKLYGKLADWEMHIRPDEMPDTDLVIIHIDKPKVEIGQQVVAGKTQIAVVRRISGVIDSQLKDFTRTGGDHVHIQLNDTTRRDYKGLRLPDDRGLGAYPGPEN